MDLVANQLINVFPTSKIFSLPVEDYATKVLLVEDDPVSRWLVRRALRYHCTLFTAERGVEAIRKFIEINPDFVLLDIELPDKDGRQILDWILNKNPEAKVIMLSCHSDPDIVTRSMEQGAKGFIAKPFNQADLLHYLKPFSEN